MKCQGRSDLAGKHCSECPRHMDDCDGHPDYMWSDTGGWEKICTCCGDEPADGTKDLCLGCEKLIGDIRKEDTSE